MMVSPVDFIVPNLLVSRGKPAFASTGVPAAVNDGVYDSSSTWRAEGAPAWVAIQVGVGPSRVLVSWTAPIEFDHTDAASGAPSSYRIESSADSTNGADGDWRLEVTATENAVRSRAHSFEFDGQSWVRLVVTGAASASAVSIAEIDVHDASDGTDDTWFFLGETSSALRGFAEHVHAEYPGYFPALIDGAVRGELTADGLARIDEVLARNPDYRHFALAYGAADALARVGVEGFRSSLLAIVDRVVAAGRIPVIARIPVGPEAEQGPISEYNRAIDEVVRDKGLLTGPESPAPRLWAEAMDVVYAPQ